MSNQVSLRNFNRDRWAWLDRVMCDPDLTDTTKLVADRLATKFAHHATGRCTPADKTIATSVCKKPDTVYRAIRALIDAGYLIVLDRGRGRGSYGFGLPEGSSANVVQFQSEHGPSSENEAGKPDLHPGSEASASAFDGVNPDADPPNSDEHPSPPIPPYKDKPKLEPKAVPVRPAPHLRVCIRPGSAEHEAWNEALSKLGEPNLEDLGIPSSDEDGTGFDAPFNWPPKRSDGTPWMIFEKWLLWANCRMRERAVA